MAAFYALTCISYHNAENNALNAFFGKNNLLAVISPLFPRYFSVISPKSFSWLHENGKRKIVILQFAKRAKNEEKQRKSLHFRGKTKKKFA